MSQPPNRDDAPPRPGAGTSLETTIQLPTPALAPSAQGPLALLVLGGPTPGVYPLPAQGEVVLGRAPECFVCIDDASVSRQHAALRVGTVLTLRDLGSKNGTRLGGVTLPEGLDREVPAGAVIELGSVTLAVQRAGAVTPGALAPAAVAARELPRASVAVGDAEGPVVVPGSAIQRILSVVDRVAADNISVLLLGETGVGKEVLAEAIHQRSPRRDHALLRLHCAAVSETLFESELFGHEKGAFTGAGRAKPGLLETADGGTVFIDEVGELPPAVQVKLLRFLEDKRVTRVGALRGVAVDVRFVAATNRDLDAEVARGAFRQDLYFRLGGISLWIPPLRERVEEIPGLARAIVARACAERNRPPVALSPEALAVLERHAWPGNIRELKNALVRAILLCTDECIRPGDLAPEVLGGRTQPAARPAVTPSPRLPSTDPSAGRPLGTDDDARARITEALAACAGNQTEAARRLGISRRTLLYRLDELGIPRPRKV